MRLVQAYAKKKINVSFPHFSCTTPTTANSINIGSYRKNTINSSTSKLSTSINTVSDLDDRRRSFGEQVPSHYSTEKSGSSGYYSSNVYSTSSVEDHIYSEPVIGGLATTDNSRQRHRKLDQQIGLANLEKSIKTLEKHLKYLTKSSLKIDQGKQHHHHQQQQHVIKKDAKDTRDADVDTVGDDATAAVLDEHNAKRLPTIVEGMDNNAAAMALVPYGRNAAHHQRSHHRNSWAAETTDGDSLMDLDLDTFLLIDETRDKKKKSNFTQIRSEGIENPTFQSDNENDIDVVDDEDDDDDDDDVDDDDSEPDDGIDIDLQRRRRRHTQQKQHSDNEHANGNSNRKTSSVARNSDDNTYKCTKYINSCPDDAYNVDEITDYKYEPPHHYPFADKLLPFYMKNIEDQLNQQNTKDILEEIRDKLTVLLKPLPSLPPAIDDTEHESSTESDGMGESSSKCNSSSIAKPDSLIRNINALKRDVDNYLVLLNQQNELEIRAFCSGLSNNYKLLTMQHALGNRTRRQKGSTSDIGSELYSNSNSSGSGSQHNHHHHHHHPNNPSLVRRRRRLKNQMKRNRK